MRSCVGPAGTVPLVDAGRLFHRGRPPERSDRFALFYGYTNRRPPHPFYCGSAFSEEQTRRLTGGPSERERACAYWR